MPTRLVITPFQVFPAWDGIAWGMSLGWRPQGHSPRQARNGGALETTLAQRLSWFSAYSGSRKFRHSRALEFDAEKIRYRRICVRCPHPSPPAKQMLRPHFVLGLWGPAGAGQTTQNSESPRGSTHSVDSAPRTHKRDANAALLLFCILVFPRQINTGLRRQGG